MSSDDPTFQRWLPYIRDKVPDLDVEAFVSNIANLRSMTDCSYVTAIKLLSASGNNQDLSVEWFFGGSHDFDENEEELQQYLKSRRIDIIPDDLEDKQDDFDANMDDMDNFGAKAANLDDPVKELMGHPMTDRDLDETSTTTTATISGKISTSPPIDEDKDEDGNSLMSANLAKKSNKSRRPQVSSKTQDSSIVSFEMQEIAGESPQSAQNLDQGDHLVSDALLFEDDDAVSSTTITTNDKNQNKKKQNNSKSDSKKSSKHQTTAYDDNGDDLDEDGDDQFGFEAQNDDNTLFGGESSLSSSTTANSSMSSTNSAAYDWLDDLESLLNPISIHTLGANKSKANASVKSTLGGRTAQKLSSSSKSDKTRSLDDIDDGDDIGNDNSRTFDTNDPNQFVSLHSHTGLSSSDAFSPYISTNLPNQSHSPQTTTPTPPLPLHIGQLALLYFINPSLLYSDTTRHSTGHPYANHWRFQLSSRKVPIRSYARSILSEPRSHRIQRANLLPLLNNPIERKEYELFTVDSVIPPESPKTTSPSSTSSPTRQDIQYTNSTGPVEQISDQNDQSYRQSCNETMTDGQEDLETRTTIQGYIDESLYGQFMSPDEAIDQLSHEFACNLVFEPNYMFQLRRSDMKHRGQHIFPVSSGVSGLDQNVTKLKEIVKQLPDTAYSIHDSSGIDFSALLTAQLVGDGDKNEQNQGEEGKNAKKTRKTKATTWSSKAPRKSLIAISSSSESEDDDDSALQPTRGVDRDVYRGGKMQNTENGTLSSCFDENDADSADFIDSSNNVRLNSDLNLGDAYWIDYIRSTSEYNVSFAEDRIGALNEYFDQELYGEEWGSDDVFFAHLLHSNAAEINTALPQVNDGLNFNHTCSGHTSGLMTNSIANDTSSSSTSLSPQYPSNPITTAPTMTILGPPVRIPTQPQTALATERFFYLTSSVPAIDLSFISTTSPTLDPNTPPHPSTLPYIPNTLSSTTQHVSAPTSTFSSSHSTSPSTALPPYHQLTYRHHNTLSSHCLELSEQIASKHDIAFHSIPSFPSSTTPPSPPHLHQLSAIVPPYLAPPDIIQAYNQTLFYNFENLMFSAILSYLHSWSLYGLLNTLKKAFTNTLMSSQSHFDTNSLNLSSILRSQQFILYAQQSPQYRHLAVVIGLLQQSMQSDYFELFKINDNLLHTTFHHPHLSNKAFLTSMLKEKVQSDDLGLKWPHFGKLAQTATTSASNGSKRSTGSKNATLQSQLGFRRSASLSSKSSVSNTAANRDTPPFGVTITSTKRTFMGEFAGTLDDDAKRKNSLNNLQIMHYLVYGGISDALLYNQAQNSEDLFNFKQIKLLELFYNNFKPQLMFPILPTQDPFQKQAQSHYNTQNTHVARKVLNYSQSSKNVQNTQSLLLDNRFPHQFPFLFQHTLTAPSRVLFRHIYRESHGIKRPFNFHNTSHHHRYLQPTYTARSVPALLNQYVRAINDAFDVDDYFFDINTMTGYTAALLSAPSSSEATDTATTVNNTDAMDSLGFNSSTALQLEPRPLDRLLEDALRTGAGDEHGLPNLSTTASTTMSDSASITYASSLTNTNNNSHSTTIINNSNNNSNNNNKNKTSRSNPPPRLPWYPLATYSPDPDIHTPYLQDSIVNSYINYDNKAESNQLLSSHPLSSRLSITPSTTPSSFYNLHQHLSQSDDHFPFREHIISSLKNLFKSMLETHFSEELTKVRRAFGKRSQDLTNINREKARLANFEQQLTHAEDSLRNNHRRIADRKDQHFIEVQAEMMEAVGSARRNTHQIEQQVKSTAYQRSAHDPDILQWSADLIQYQSGLPALKKQIEEIKKTIQQLYRGQEVTIDAVVDELFQERLKQLYYPSNFQIFDKVAFFYARFMKTTPMVQGNFPQTPLSSPFYHLFTFSPQDDHNSEPNSLFGNKIDLTGSIAASKPTPQARAAGDNQNKRFTPPPLNLPTKPSTLLPPVLQLGTYLLLNQPRPMITTMQYCHLLATLQALAIKGYKSNSPIVLLVAQLLKDGLTVIEQPTIYRVTDIFFHKHKAGAQSGGVIPPEFVPATYQLQLINSVNRTTGTARRHRTAGPEHTTDSVNDRFRLLVDHANLVKHGARVIHIPHSPIVRIFNNKVATQGTQPWAITPNFNQFAPETVYPSYTHVINDNNIKYNHQLPHSFDPNSPRNLNLFSPQQHLSSVLFDNFTKQPLFLNDLPQDALKPPQNLPLGSHQHQHDPFHNYRQYYLQNSTNRYQSGDLVSPYLPSTSLPPLPPQHTMPNALSSPTLPTSLSALADPTTLFQTCFLPTDFTHLDFNDTQSPLLRILKPNTTSSDLPPQTPSFALEHTPISFQSAITAPQNTPMNLPLPPLHSPHGHALWYIYSPKAQQILADSVELRLSTNVHGLDSESDDDNYQSDTQLNSIQSQFAVSAPALLTKSHKKLKKLKNLTDITCGNLFSESGKEILSKLRLDLSRSNIFYSTGVEAGGDGLTMKAAKMVDGNSDFQKMFNNSSGPSSLLHAHPADSQTTLSSHTLSISSRNRNIPATISQPQKRLEIIRTYRNSLVIHHRTRRTAITTRGELQERLRKSFQEMVNAAQTKKDKQRLTREYKDQLERELGQYFYGPKTIEQVGLVEYPAILDQRVILTNLAQCKAFIDLHLVYDGLPQLLNDNHVVQNHLEATVAMEEKSKQNSQISNNLDNTSRSYSNFSQTPFSTVPIYTNQTSDTNRALNMVPWTAGPFEANRQTITDSTIDLLQLNRNYLDPYCLARDIYPSFVLPHPTATTGRVGQGMNCSTTPDLFTTSMSTSYSTSMRDADFMTSQLPPNSPLISQNFLNPLQSPYTCSVPAGTDISHLSPYMLPSNTHINPHFGDLQLLPRVLPPLPDAPGIHEEKRRQRVALENHFNYVEKVDPTLELLRPTLTTGTVDRNSSVLYAPSNWGNSPNRDDDDGVGRSSTHNHRNSHKTATNTISHPGHLNLQFILPLRSLPRSHLYIPHLSTSFQDNFSNSHTFDAQNTLSCQYSLLSPLLSLQTLIISPSQQVHNFTPKTIYPSALNHFSFGTPLPHFSKNDSSERENFLTSHRESIFSKSYHLPAPVYFIPALHLRASYEEDKRDRVAREKKEEEAVTRKQEQQQKRPQQASKSNGAKNTPTKNAVKGPAAASASPARKNGAKTASTENTASNDSMTDLTASFDLDEASPFISISEQALIKRLLPSSYWETIKTISSLPPPVTPITAERTGDDEANFAALPQYIHRQDGECNSTDELFKFALCLQISPEINPDNVLASYIDLTRALNEGYAVIASAYISSSNVRIEPDAIMSLCNIPNSAISLRPAIHTLASCYNTPLTTFAPNSMNHNTTQFHNCGPEHFAPSQFIVIIKVYSVTQQALLRSNADTTTTLVHKQPLLLLYSLQQQYIELFAAREVVLHFLSERKARIELRKRQIGSILDDGDFDSIHSESGAQSADINNKPAAKGKRGEKKGSSAHSANATHSSSHLRSSMTASTRKATNTSPMPSTALGVVARGYDNIDQSTPLETPEELFGLTGGSINSSTSSSLPTHSKNSSNSSEMGGNGPTSTNFTASPIRFSPLQYNSPVQFRLLFETQSRCLDDLNKQLRYVALFYKLLTTNHSQLALPLSTVLLQNYTRYYFVLNAILTVQRVEKLATIVSDQSKFPFLGPHQPVFDSFMSKLITNTTDKSTALVSMTDVMTNTPLTSTSLISRSNHHTTTSTPSPVLTLSPLVKNHLQSRYNPIYPLKNLLLPRSPHHFTPFLAPEFKITNQSGPHLYLLLKSMISSALSHPLNKTALQEVLLYESFDLGPVSQRLHGMQRVAPLPASISLPKDPLSLSIRTTFNPQTDILPQHLRDLVHLDLHDYQHQTVSWAVKLEKAQYNINSLLYTPFLLPSGRLLWFSLPLGAIVSQLPAGNKRGGIIATDMGLGKTACCLAVIASNPRRIGLPYSWQEPGTLKQAESGTIVVTEALKRQQILLDSAILHHYSDESVNSYFDTLYNPKPTRIPGILSRTRALATQNANTSTALTTTSTTHPPVPMFSECQLFDALSHYTVRGSDPLRLIEAYYNRSNVIPSPIGDGSASGRSGRPNQIAGNGMLCDGKFDAKTLQQILLGAEAQTAVSSADVAVSTSTNDVDADIETRTRGRSSRTKRQQKKEDAVVGVRAGTLLKNRFAVSKSGHSDEDDGDDDDGKKGENTQENDDTTSSNASNTALFTSPFAYAAPEPDPVRQFIKAYVTSSFYANAPNLVSGHPDHSEPISLTHLTSLHQTPPLPQSSQNPQLTHCKGKLNPHDTNSTYQRDFDNELMSAYGDDKLARELATDLNDGSFAKVNQDDNYNSFYPRKGGSMTRSSQKRTDEAYVEEHQHKEEEEEEEEGNNTRRWDSRRNTKAIASTTTTTKSKTPTKNAKSTPMTFPGHIWSGCTLIIVPKSILGMWVKKIKTQTPHLSIYVLQEKREQDPMKIASYDIAITTNFLFSISCEILSQIDWHRIIVDEAQWLRSRSSDKMASLRLLQTNSLLLVTGTPYSSHITEIRGLLDALGVDTLGNIDLSTTSGQLAYNWYYRQIFTNMCIRHTKLQPFNGKRTLVKLPKKSYHLHIINQTIDEFKIYQRIYAAAFKRFTLLHSADAIRYNAFNIVGMLNGVRRAASINDVSAPNQILRCLSSNFFTSSLVQYQRQIDQQQVRQQRAVDQVQNQLNALINATTAAQVSEATSGVKNTSAAPRSRIQDIFDNDRNIRYDKLPQCDQDGYSIDDCVICFCEMDQPVLTGCLHPFCATCLADLLKSNNNGWGGPPACPICRLTIDPTALSIPATPLDEVELARLEAEKAVQIAKTQAELDALQAFIEQAQNARSDNSTTAKNQKHQGQSYEALLKDQERALMSHYQSGIILSSKMRILLSLVEEIIAKNEKVVIFSQFQHSLDYIKKLLLARRITFGYTDGTQQSSRRDKEVTNFTNNPLCSVFVVGYRVGSVGITLNAANHVILCDPCLNRAQEEQACNRIYRLGQQRDVQIHYLISKGTIEEQIYLLNESRRSAELAHSGSEKDKQKKTANRDVINNIDIAKLMADPFISHTSTKSTPARQTNITTYTMNSLTSISNMAASRRHHGGDVDDSDDDFFTATDNTISSSTTTTSDTLTNIANYFKTKAALSLAKSSLSATFQASNSMNKTSFGFGSGFDVVDLDALEQEENSLKDAFEEEEAEEEEEQQQQRKDKDGDGEPIVTIAKKKSRSRKKKDDNVALNDNDYIFMFSIIPDESHESYESQEDVAEEVDS